MRCAGRAVCRKLTLPRTLTCLGPTSFVHLSSSRAFSAPLPSTYALGHPWFSLHRCLLVISNFSASVFPSGCGARSQGWPLASVLEVPGHWWSSAPCPCLESCVSPANQVEGGGWWEVAKTSPPARCAPSSEENCYILWTI